MLRTVALGAAVALSTVEAMPSHPAYGLDMDKMNFARNHKYNAAGDDPEGSTFIDVPGTRCMDGEQTGYWFRQGASDKFVTYLMPGGACFNALCETLATSDPRGTYLPSNEGIFDTKDESNEMRDYTWIFIPYCTGDVFVGNTEGQGGYKTRQFRGREHVDLVFKDVESRVQDKRISLDTSLDTFVMTGESAGGFGALANWDFIRQNYITDASGNGTFKAKNNIMITDSGVAMFDSALRPCLQKNWRERWGANPNIPQDCTKCTNANGDGGGLGNIWDFLVQKYSNDRFGMISSDFDSVIAAFFGFGLTKDLFGSGCGTIPSLTGGANFNNGLQEMFNHTEHYSNVCHFVFPGTDHTHTGQAKFFDSFFTTSDMDDDREVFLHDWYSHIIKGTEMEHCSVEHLLF